MAEVEEKIEETVSPTGRESILESYRASNPDSQEDPDDEGLFGFARDRYSDLEGKHNELSGANSKLAELVAKDPKLGALLSSIAGENPMSVPRAISSIYGKEPFDLEGDALDEFEAGYQENLARLAESEQEREQASKNIEEYQGTLVKYGEDNELDEGRLSEIHDGVMQFAENVLMGIIPVELIDLIYKGKNYDRDVQEAADTGFVEGKNGVVEAKMKEKTAESSVPDLGSGTGAGKTTSRPKQTKGSFYDGIQE